MGVQLTAISADYADDECIRQLLKWKHPYCNLTTDIEYTDQETLRILNLPRKECKLVQVFRRMLVFKFFYRSPYFTSDAQPISGSDQSSLLLCL